jgi:hypothetical protein
MEKIYTLVQPSEKENKNVYFRNITTKISEISEDFMPTLSFDFTIEYQDGSKKTTSNIDTFKKLVLENDWWAASNDNQFVIKCEEYVQNRKTGIAQSDNSEPDKIEFISIKEPLPKKDHVNPTHYQNYFEMEDVVLQWLETQQYLPRFRNQEVFKGAVELQARKYLDRLGGKDEESQEIMKAVWYLRFLAAYVRNGGPIRVADIDSILSGAHASSNGS